MIRQGDLPRTVSALPERGQRGAVSPDSVRSGRPPVVGRSERNRFGPLHHCRQLDPLTLGRRPEQGGHRFEYVQREVTTGARRTLIVGPDEVDQTDASEPSA
ncbi:hypothetical protein NKG94_02470 [Micromonospora sp. M12]